MREGRRFQLVLCDVHLPGISGVDVLKEFRRALGHATPIVMMSSSEEVSLIEQCVVEGADSYMIKPPRQRTVAPPRHANATRRHVPCQHVPSPCACRRAAPPATDGVGHRVRHRPARPSAGRALRWLDRLSLCGAAVLCVCAVRVQRK
jgi:CheY-like chemotaxis protein